MVTILAMTLLFHSSISVYAADATVTFGSNMYEQSSGEEFPIGLYLKGDSVIANYHVELKYDSKRLQYISGADEVDEENGILIFDGTSSATEIKFWITFKAISGGEIELEVSSAVVTTTNGENFTMTTLQSVPIQLSGEDIVGKNEIIQKPSEETEVQEPSVSENIEKDKTEENSQKVTESKTEKKKVTKEGDKSSKDRINIFKIVAIIVLGFLIIFVTLVGILYLRERKRSKRRRRLRNSRDRQMVSRSESIETRKEREKNNIVVRQIKETLDEKKEEEEPVIKVDDVTMKFKISTSNASGIKEYLIQLVKHQISFRELLALDHVSFDVYKGEVVGIIGTNGSGKSTLLKIVSGALNPTSGQVVVDKKKIQLLTLGTGFDMELSARENVYLNGAIIGYSREFIDKHYNEIVEFAELQDFMEEKVKNFSSGMVSRLGFAIATVGDAAEILILDEVLSVGDEFFRKKSLKRVKEMIHGGSTVLIVSHSMRTIQENCTKVVWIEKGKLIAVGNPKEVCTMYSKSKEERQ